MEEVIGPGPVGPSESTALLSSSVLVTCSPVVQQDPHSSITILSCLISELYELVLEGIIEQFYIFIALNMFFCSKKKNKNSERRTIQSLEGA